MVLSYFTDACLRVGAAKDSLSILDSELARHARHPSKERCPVKSYITIPLTDPNFIFSMLSIGTLSPNDSPRAGRLRIHVPFFFRNAM